MGEAKRRKKAKQERLTKMMVYSYMYCTFLPNYSKFLGIVDGATAIDSVFDDPKVTGKRQEAIDTLLKDKIWNSNPDEYGCYYSLIEEDKMLNEETVWVEAEYENTTPELDEEEEEKTIWNLETREIFDAMAKEMDRREMEEPQKHWSEIRKEVEEEYLPKITNKVE